MARIETLPPRRTRPSGVRRGTSQRASSTVRPCALARDHHLVLSRAVPVALPRARAGSRTHAAANEPEILAAPPPPPFRGTVPRNHHPRPTEERMALPC